MSLIIKGKDIPKSCYDCDLYSGEGFLCPLVIETTNDWVLEAMYKRVDECPLVEIPTAHGRLIDADRFLDWLKEFHPNDVAIMSGVKNARTVVEAEEVQE